jgi:uncharacterized repeat protein (TIGR01451 family)
MSRLGVWLTSLALTIQAPLVYAQFSDSPESIDLAAYTIVMVVDHDRITSDQQVYDAYGMALHLANRGLLVDWWIAQDKGYEEVDFEAETDDAPDPDTADPDGTVASRAYRAGPFVIRDPDPTTSEYNEAWDHIHALQAEWGYAPLLHEIRELTTLPRLNAGILTFMPRIAYSSHKGIAEDQLELASIPAFSIDAPGTASAPATAAGGGLFEGDSDSVCGRQPAYDVFIQDHYGWDDPNDDELAALGEFDDFLRAGTTCIFECDSATVDDTLHWLTVDGNVAVEGDDQAGIYTVEEDFADHPFAQTMGEVPIEGGAFSLWDADANEFLSSAQHIFYDAVSGDYGYMLGQVEGGKFFFAGGHRRESLSDQRLILNAVLYEVVSPQFIHEVTPSHVPQGETARRTIEIRLRGGCLASNAVIVDQLAEGVSYVPRSVRLSVRGATASWDAAERQLTLDIGDADPNALADGLLAQYQVDLSFDHSGEQQLMSSSIQYDDPWTTGITFAGQLCESVEVLPQLMVRQYADHDTLVVGDNEVLITLEVHNTGETVLQDVVVTDALPDGVAFVGPIDTFGRGTADFGTTTSDELTWNAGWLAPGERAAATFAVVASPDSTGEFLLNDSPSATAVVEGSSSLTGDGQDITVNAVDDRGPQLVFSLAPDQVETGTAVTLDFEVTNFGQDEDHDRADYITITIPDGWSEPTNIVVPSDWVAFYNSRDRTLTFNHPTDKIEIRSGESFSFSFDVEPPNTAGLGLFAARGTINADPVVAFEAHLPIGVVNGDGQDSDGDGLIDSDEDRLGTDPDNPDSDGDGLPDGYEVGPDPSDPRNSDDDDDIDALDTDSDNDGIDDEVEGTGDPDGDGIPNYLDGDSDGDSLDDADEETLGTDRLDADSDDDGVADGEEPGHDVDTDGDDLIGALDPDSDDDGIMDGTEMGETEPLPDTDESAGNFVADADPTTTTDPLKADTDGGGSPDGAEDLDADGAYEPDEGETDPEDPSDDSGSPGDSGIDGGTEGDGGGTAADAGAGDGGGTAADGGAHDGGGTAADGGAGDGGGTAVDGGASDAGSQADSGASSGADGGQTGNDGGGGTGTVLDGSTANDGGADASPGSPAPSEGCACTLARPRAAPAGRWLQRLRQLLLP